MINYVKILRIKQWIKNVFVFAPLVFALQLFNLEKVFLSIFAFFSFCLASSAGYIFNDIIDKERDRRHPKKKHRPIASGKIPVKAATIYSLALALASIFLSLKLSRMACFVIVSYLILNLLYSLLFKHFVILDVFTIATGFVLRVMMGGYAINVPISNWLLLTTFAISIFLGFGKRKLELKIEKREHYREVLKYYNEKFLDFLIVTSISVTIVTYALYTMDQRTIGRFGTQNLIFTVPFVVYGLFRYLYILFNTNTVEDPDEIIIKDPGIIAAVILWIITVVLIIY